MMSVNSVVCTQLACSVFNRTASLVFTFTILIVLFLVLTFKMSPFLFLLYFYLVCVPVMLRI